MNIEIHEHVPLAPYTAMHVGGPARFLVTATTAEELVQAVTWAQHHELEILLIGGGSNMIISDDGFTGLVICLNFRGIALDHEDDQTVLITAAASEMWDDVVAYAVQHNWWGIENLSHIPGRMGAIAVQNVGAYGQEASQVITQVTVFDTQSLNITVLTADDCQFAYRQSIFNSSQKGRYIILSIQMKLQKNPQPMLGYAGVQAYFEEKNIKQPQLLDIREAIIAIRDRKLPLPSKMANSGSFFKNVLLSEDEFDALYQRVNQAGADDILQKLQNFRAKFLRDGQIKIPTAFLIEHAGFKGFCVGGACISEQHALVMLNPKKEATAHDIMSLFTHVRRGVYAEFGLEIVNEPELIGFREAALTEYFSLTNDKK